MIGHLTSRSSEPGTRLNAKVDNSDDTTFDRSTAPHFCAPLREMASDQIRIAIRLVIVVEL